MIEVEKNSAHRRANNGLWVVLLGSVPVVVVALLAYIRLLDKPWSEALADIGFVSIMLLLFLFVYVGRKARTASLLIALGFISAALTATLLLGVSELIWAFPALMVAYFVLDARQATILTAGFVVCFMAIGWDDLSAIALTKICLTVVTTVLLANAFSLTNRRQLEELRRMVHVDPLTTAGNRRALDTKLDSASAIFRRNNSPVCLLILDIDHFKRINDTHGHTVGDKVLVELSELMRRTTRATETLYRYGGEEFVVVAEQTSLNSAVYLAENVRDRIEHHVFSTGIRVTVSIGVAQLRRVEDCEAWLKRADTVLYRAKGRGRNLVIAAGEHVAPTLVRFPKVDHRGQLEAAPVPLARSM